APASLDSLPRIDWPVQAEKSSPSMLSGVALAKRGAPQPIFFRQTHGTPALKISLALSRPHRFLTAIKALMILCKRLLRARVSTVILSGCPGIYFRWPKMGARKLKMNSKRRNVPGQHQKNSIAFLV